MKNALGEVVKMDRNSFVARVFAANETYITHGHKTMKAAILKANSAMKRLGWKLVEPWSMMKR
jgi:hypothetical protein